MMQVASSLRDLTQEEKYMYYRIKQAKEQGIGTKHLKKATHMPQ